MIFDTEIALAVVLNAGIVVQTADPRASSDKIMLRRRAESGTFDMNCTGRPNIQEHLPPGRSVYARERNRAMTSSTVKDRAPAIIVPVIPITLERP